MAHIVVLQILIKNENICKVTYCVNSSVQKMYLLSMKFEQDE